jgi:hypothetical protein
MPVSFSQCPLFIFISIPCQKDKRAKPGSLHAKQCSFEYQGALERNTLAHCFSKGARSITRQIACFWLSGHQSGPQSNDDVIRNSSGSECETNKVSKPQFPFFLSAHRLAVMSSKSAPLARVFVNGKSNSPHSQSNNFCVNFFVHYRSFILSPGYVQCDFKLG